MSFSLFKFAQLILPYRSQTSEEKTIPNENGNILYRKKPKRNKTNKKTVQFKARSSSQAWHKTPADFTDVKRKGMHNDMSDDLKRIIGVLIHLNIRRKNHSDSLLYYNHVTIATMQMHLLQFVKIILAIPMNQENFRILFSLIYMVTSPSSDTLMPIP